MLQTFGTNFKLISAKPKYKMVCPFCFCDEVKFIGVNVQTELAVSTNPRFKKAEKQPLFGNEYHLNKYDKTSSHSSILLKKIEDFLGIPDNALEIEEKLTKEELSYLLKNGEIFEARRGEYRLLE